ncbi:MAG: DUF6402 family protein [Lactococcus garvieae]
MALGFEMLMLLAVFLFGFQPYVSRDVAVDFLPVNNSDFRNWQDKHNAGGDFIVFSDVLWLNPLPNQRIIYL